MSEATKDLNGEVTFLADITRTINQIVQALYPTVQGIYLYGSYVTGDEWPKSDIDIALLLPPKEASREKSLALSPCRLALETALTKEIDLVNARQVSTVLQKEIIANGALLFCSDRYAVDEFEMLVISYYQKLNEERREILETFSRTGKAYPV